jgi:hypothetical protein
VLNTARNQVKAKEGCQFEGEVLLHKVPGNFHISSHDNPNVMMTLIREGFHADFTHKIDHLSFGVTDDQKTITKRYGQKIANELSSTEKKQQIPFGQWMVNYYLDITEAEYTDSTYTVEVTDEKTGEKR